MEVELSATVDAADILSGGLRQRSTTFALFEANFDFDLERLLGWPRATAHAGWFARPGRTLNDDVGDVQGNDWMDGPDRSELYQLWIELWPIADTLRLKLGKLEGFDEVGVVDAAGEFLNNGPAYSPTLEPMPTYPDSAYGAVAGLYPGEHGWLTLAVMDGAGQTGLATGEHGASTFFGEPSDLFLVAEAGGDWPRGDALLAGRAALGGWRHTGDFTRFDGGEEDGADGLYALVEQELWAAAPDEADDARGLAAFLQFGATDGDVISVRRHLAAGLRWQGPFESRAEDSCGLAASRAGLSRAPGAGFTADDELALEAYYRFQLTPWLAVQPDLQLVRNPGGLSGADDAVVGILRFELAL